MSVGTPYGVTLRHADITSSGLFTRAGDTTDTPLSAGDYIRFTNWDNPENNGLWRIISRTDDNTLSCVKVDGDAPVAESSTAGVRLDEDPINSPDAIIVDADDGTDIAGAANVPSVSFDYDFTNNNQGSRIPSSNTTAWPDQTVGNPANTTIRAIGFNTAQFVEVEALITRATGLSFSVVSGLERNYSNP